MKNISYASSDINKLQEAEDWLVRQGYQLQEDSIGVWRVRNGRAELEMFKGKEMAVWRTSAGLIAAHNHTLDSADLYHNLHGFKKAILKDMETTTKTKEGNKVDYKDICIEFDTDEQAQAFAEAVHKNGHPIVFWEKSYIGAVISFSEWRKGLARDRGAHTNKTLKAHISEAPAEWLRFLLSPVKPALKVAGYDVKITAEDAKIGCTTVTWEEVKSVYEAMKEVRS